MSEFTHFDEKGNAYMVDVSEKEITRRSASAQGTISVSPDVSIFPNKELEISGFL